MVELREMRQTTSMVASGACAAPDLPDRISVDLPDEDQLWTAQRKG
jgi:hypothetical protein